MCLSEALTMQFPHLLVLLAPETKLSKNIQKNESAFSAKMFSYLKKWNFLLGLLLYTGCRPRNNNITEHYRLHPVPETCWKLELYIHTKKKSRLGADYKEMFHRGKISKDREALRDPWCLKTRLYLQLAWKWSGQKIFTFCVLAVRKAHVSCCYIHTL